MKGCTWIGDGEGCKKEATSGRSYCLNHHHRVYTRYFSEMADYILERELKTVEPIQKNS